MSHRRYSYATSADALLRPALGAVFFEDWSPEDVQRPEMLCAEMSRLAYARQEVVAGSLPKAGFELVAFIGGDDLAARASTLGTQAFVARAVRGDPATILAFRGTESSAPEDVLTDALFFQTNSLLFPNCRVHDGFATRFAQVKDQITPFLKARQSPLLVTGHSLGAALATVAAVFLAVPARLITFGSPRVGDDAFRNLAQSIPGLDIQRFVDCCDVVARVPPKAFDAATLSQLLAELAGPKSEPERPIEELESAARGAAGTALANLLDILAPGLQFSHVCDPTYIRADGQLDRAISAADLAADQAAARKSYPFRPSLQSFLQRLNDLPSTLRNVLTTGNPSPREQFASLVRAVAGLSNGGQVASRDLADHTPINYLSAFTGRL